MAPVFALPEFWRIEVGWFSFSDGQAFPFAPFYQFPDIDNLADVVSVVGQLPIESVYNGMGLISDENFVMKIFFINWI